MSYFANAGQLLVGFAFGAIVTLFVLRLLAEYWRADFHNPLSQFLYRYTNPVLAPLRRVIPNWGRLNLAALLLAWAAEAIKTALVLALAGMAVRPLGLIVLSAAQLVDFIALLYIILIFGWALMGMIGGDPMHPLMRMVASLVEPPMRPLRRRLPAPGGIDFSPAVAILALMLARILLVQPLLDLGGRLAMGG
jgi:YggT family protein